MKKFFFISTFIFLNFSLFAQPKISIDSLEQQLISLSEDTNKVNVLLQLGKQYKQISADTSIIYFQKAIKLAKKINILNSISKCSETLGSFYADYGNYSKAIKYYQEALDINTRLKDKAGIAKNFSDIGTIYFSQSNYDKALNYFENSLKINLETKNRNATARTLGNIGNVFYVQMNYDKAIEYYQKTLKIQKEISDKTGISYSLINIGNIYSIEKSYNKAIQYYYKAIKILNETGNKKGIALSYGNISIAYENKQNLPKAIKYNKKALSINKEINNKIGVANNLAELASLYYQSKKYKQAIPNALKGLSLAKEIGALNIQKSAYNYLADIYKALKHYPIAFEYIDSAQLINDSIFNKEKTKAIAEMMIKYETEKKEKKILKQKISLQKNQLQLINAKIETEKKENQRNISLIAIVFLLILIVFFYRSYKQKQKINSLLKIQKKELENAYDELIGLNEELTVSLEKIYNQNKIIKENEEKFKSLVNLANDTIILIDNEEKIILWNKAAEKTFGYTEKEALRKNVHKLITPKKYRIIAHTAYNNFRKTGKGNAINKTLELEGLKKNGDIFPIELSLSAIYIKKEWHSLGIIRDISKRKKHELELLTHKNKIEELYKNIIHNINYAKIIQQALLPNEQMLNNALSDYFLLFMPKEIIGGDFYYIHKYKDTIIFAVADCTGHGVAGALLTILGITYIQNIITRKKLVNPGVILNTLRDRFKEAFKANGSENKSGLDIVLCSINTKTNVLTYAGANTPLWIIRNNTLLVYKATKNPIGFFFNEKEFTNTEIQLENNDILYLFSDGFADQFGGKDNKKFLIKRFRELLLSISNLSMKEQKIKLLEAFNQWKANEEQTDDITILGIKCNR